MILNLETLCGSDESSLFPKFMPGNDCAFRRSSSFATRCGIVLSLILSVTLTHSISAQAEAIMEAPPFACYLAYPSSANSITTCSGVLVAPNILATAGHCLTGDAFTKYKGYISVGCGLISEFSSGAGFKFRESFSIAGFKINSKYLNGDQRVATDLAFLVLDRPATKVTPIAMPSSFESFTQEFLITTTTTSDFNLKPTIECRVSGFGFDEVRKASFFRTTDKSPRANLQGFIGADPIQNSSLVIDNWAEPDGLIRFGDSGSPFYCRPNKVSPWVLVGVVSSMVVNGSEKRQTGTLMVALTVSDSLHGELLTLQSDARNAVAGGTAGSGSSAE